RPSICTSVRSTTGWSIVVSAATRAMLGDHFDLEDLGASELKGFAEPVPLIEQVPTAPLLVVATYRPELTPPLPQRSHMIPIPLNRLERPEVETMVAHL